MKILILGVICINIICQSKGDADPVWSSKTDGIAHSCDSSWKKQLGFTCSCSKPAVDCKRMNISNIEDLDIPDGTTSLDLSFNNLSSLLDDLTGFPFPVEELFLSHNNLETLSNLTFYNFPLLKFLDLSHNNLKIIEPGIIYHLSNLETMDLSHNKLKAFSPAVFPVINSIQRLDLSYNDLKGVDGIEPSPLSRLSELLYLDLSNCSLDRLHIDFLHNNKLLTELRLSKNQIDYIPTTALFDTRASLEFLDLSENPIKSVSSHAFHGLYGLKTLVMSSMPTLEDIDALAFHDLHSLETLDCRDNENLKHFHPQAFRDNLFQDVSLMELRYLYISGNSLSTISQQLVDWSKLSELLIGGNALECDCELAWLSTGVNSTWINDVTCSGPQELAGKLVLNAASDMKCDQTLGIEVLTVLAVIVMGFTLFIILGYLFARRQWPHHVPKINLFGESAVPQYFPLS